MDVCEVPDRGVEHPTPDGFRWIVVAIVNRPVTEGEIPRGDLYGLMQIDVKDSTEPARAVDVEDSPPVTGADGPPIEAGRGADI